MFLARKMCTDSLRGLRTFREPIECLKLGVWGSGCGQGGRSPGHKSAFGLQEAPGGFPRAKSEQELLEMEPDKFLNDF